MFGVLLADRLIALFVDRLIFFAEHQELRDREVRVQSRYPVSHPDDRLEPRVEIGRADRRVGAERHAGGRHLPQIEFAGEAAIPAVLPALHLIQEETEIFGPILRRLLAPARLEEDQFAFDDRHPGVARMIG